MFAPNPPNEQENTVMLISYKTLRTIIGLLGMFLALILLTGMYFLTGHALQSSISHFYHTRMGDVFVGFLTAISLFLFVYKGPEKKDHWAGNIAGVLGLIVAFCPASYHGAAGLNYMYNRAPFNPAWLQYVHLISAGLLLLTLAYFSIVLFPKTFPGTKVQPGSMKKKRNIAYYICGCAMIACVIALIICFAVLQPEQIHNSIIVFVLEALALFFFGFSWFVKGEQIILRD